MKTRSILGLLVALNVALVAALVVVLANRPQPASEPFVVKYVTNTTEAAVSPPPAVETVVRPAGLQKIWQEVESTNYAAYISNLRAIGCPEETIRDIIITDINKLYAQRLRAFEPWSKQTNLLWWQQPAYRPADYVEYQKQSRLLNREKRELVKTLLGAELNQEMRRQQGYPDYQAQQLAFLSEDKRTQIQAVNDKYNDLEAALYEKTDAEMPRAQKQQQFNQYRDQRKAEIAALLTPAEAEQYDMRTSQTGQTLRYNLASFEATEQEFRAVFQLQKAFDEQCNSASYDPTNAARLMQTRAEAQKKLDADLQAALGAERYADYKRSLDYNYTAVYQVTRHYQLPKETALSVYETKKAAEAQKAQIAGQQDWTPDQRATALTTLRDTTDQAVRNALGAVAFKEYQASVGNWIQNLGTAPPARPR
jgi:hypothetical protein